MTQQKQKTPIWMYLMIPILIIGGFRYYNDLQVQDDIFKNPKAGDYYVFYNILKDIEGAGISQVLKVKEVKGGVVVFYIPQKELEYGYDGTQEEKDLIVAEDIAGGMFSDAVMEIEKWKLLEYVGVGKVSSFAEKGTVSVKHAFRAN